MINKLLLVPPTNESDHGADQGVDVHPDTAIDEALVGLRDIERQMKRLQERKEALREVVVMNADFSASDRYERPLATIKLVPAYERVSYDRKGLDRLAESRPEIATLLSFHRKVSTVGPSVRIQWNRGA